MALYRARTASAVWFHLPQRLTSASANAAILAHDPAATHPPSLAAPWAGKRTLACFSAPRPLAFPQWRAQLRRPHSPTLLARPSVTATAVTCGYNTPSAFTAAFRATFGTTRYWHFPKTWTMPGQRCSPALGVIPIRGFLLTSGLCFTAGPPRRRAYRTKLPMRSGRPQRLRRSGAGRSARPRSTTRRRPPECECSRDRHRVSEADCRSPRCSWCCGPRWPLDAAAAAAEAGAPRSVRPGRQAGADRFLIGLAACWACCPSWPGTGRWRAWWMTAALDHGLRRRAARRAARRLESEGIVLLVRP